MRRPRKPATSPLHALIQAVPIETLRELALNLMLDGTITTMPAPADPAEPEPARRPRRAYKRRPGSRPPGRKRRGRPRKTVNADAEQKRIVRNRREAERQREKRRAAKEAAAEHGGNCGSNGQEPAKPAATAKDLWEHAARISPKTPWRAVARELGTNEAQALDAYRSSSLPPGITANAIERFLELSAP